MTSRNAPPLPPPLLPLHAVLRKRVIREQIVVSAIAGIGLSALLVATVLGVNTHNGLNQVSDQISRSSFQNTTNTMEQTVANETTFLIQMRRKDGYTAILEQKHDVISVAVAHTGSNRSWTGVRETLNEALDLVAKIVMEQTAPAGETTKQEPTK
jgi:hypothetical protein